MTKDTVIVLKSVKPGVNLVKVRILNFVVEFIEVGGRDTFFPSTSSSLRVEMDESSEVKWG